MLRCAILAAGNKPVSAEQAQLPGGKTRRIRIRSDDDWGDRAYAAGNVRMYYRFAGDDAKIET